MLYTHRANSREAYQESKEAAKRQDFSQKSFCKDLERIIF
jgi:hypothetical protein